MKRLVLLVGLVLVMALAGCGGGGGDGGLFDDDGLFDGNDGGGGDDGGTAQPLKEWTYMVYMGADNNLSTAGLIDLNEMETVGSDDKVNIVLQAEFSTKFTPFDDFGLSYGGKTLRFLVKNDNDPNNIDLAAGTSIGNVNMGSPDTLRDFIQWAAETYPAKRYALAIWDHGAGWKVSPLTKGAVEDETNGGWMTLPDLAKGVADSGVDLDLINFDACLMGMYEVAYEFRGLTDYLVFSEETEPGDGDPYDTILAALRNKPAMGAEELAGTIVDKYFTYYKNSERQEAVTKSAVALDGIDALHGAVGRLSDALVGNFAAVSAAVASAQSNSQNYYYPTNYDLYDFCDSLASQLPAGAVRNAALEVMGLLEDASFVVANKSLGGSVSGSKGLAIFAPMANQISGDDVVDELREYAKLACNRDKAAGWYDAVEAMMAGQTQDVVPGGFSFYIEWDSDADLDLYVWEPQELYAPWMGQTTPNGFFSGDSANTGLSEEYYSANDYVQPGDYDVIINYHQDGLFSNSANVTFWYYEPQSSSDWQSAGPFQLDLNQELGNFDNITDLEQLNGYSDWWYPGNLSRAAAVARPVRINAGDRAITLRFQQKKSAPSLDHIRR